LTATVLRCPAKWLPIVMLVIPGAALTACGQGRANATPTQSREAIGAQLMDMERSFWDSVRRQDRQAMERLMSPEYQYISYRGLEGRTRAEELAIHFGGRLRLDTFRLTHWRIVWLTDDAVMLHYMNEAAGEVDGKPEKQLGGAVSTWARHGGEWKVVARSEWKIAPEEFPRD